MTCNIDLNPDKIRSQATGPYDLEQGGEGAQ